MIALLTACLFFEILVHVLNYISESARENCSATLNKLRARYFWLLESATVSQALTRAPRQPASVITSILKSPKYRTWSIQIFY